MHFSTNIMARAYLSTRSSEEDGGPSDSTISSMIALLSIVFVGLLISSLLMMLRRVKQQQRERQMTLPQYQQQSPGKSPGLTIKTTGVDGRSSTLIFGRDGQPMLANPMSPPYSPDNVPEIRITFPDEHDESGQRKTGRVVIVRVGETSIGMEPVVEQEEQLPAYEKESKGQFYSIDMNEIGGLKEKSEHSNY